MGMFDIGGGGSRTYWNYTNPKSEKEPFATTLTGDVVEITAVPSYKYNSNEIDRWPSGDMRIDMLITVMRADGQERCFRVKKFNTSSRRDYWSNIQCALFDALEKAGLPGGSLKELGGLNITIATKQPPEGFGYGVNNPRPFTCQVNGRGTAPFRGCIDETQAVDGTAGKPQLETPTIDVANPGQAKLADTMAKAAQAMGYPAPKVVEVDPAAVYDEDIPF